MLSTGDVQGCLRKLETLLRVIKYPGNVDYNGLSKGDPSAFLPIVSFTLTSYSPPIAEQLIGTGLELTSKTDLRFTDTLYKILRDVFHYKPILTKQQFLQWGFSQRKISVISDIINLVLHKHNHLKKLRDRCRASNSDCRGAQPTLTEADPVSIRPFVVNQTENPSTFLMNTPSEKAFSHSSNSDSSGIEMTKLAGGVEDKHNILHSSDVEERPSALEAQLESLSGLHRLSILEKRLEKLERQRNTDKNEGQVINISRESWENLISRVLLLETKLELRETQLNGSLPCLSSASSYSTSFEASKEDTKDRLERITNMLKSTSMLLKNTESSTTPRK